MVRDDLVFARSDLKCFLLRRANASATRAPIRPAPRTPPTAPPTVAELSAGHRDLSNTVLALDEQVEFDEEPLAAAGASVVKLNVVLIAAVEPGRSRLPMWDVEIIDELSPQQFSVSEPARQQNLPGSHCKTDHEYWLPTAFWLALYSDSKGRLRTERAQLSTSVCFASLVCTAIDVEEAGKPP